MTQTNNEREAFEKWFEEWRLSTWKPLPNDARKECPKHWAMNAKHHMDIAWNARAKSPISQNEQQEAVATVKRVREIYPNEWFGTMDVDWEKLKDGDKLYTSPPKQAIPEGWEPIETVPKDGTQVIIKCSGGRVATAFYDDKPFVGGRWHVVVPFLGGFGSGTDTFIFFPEDMPTHWMPLPPAPTNTEVGE